MLSPMRCPACPTDSRMGGDGRQSRDLEQRPVDVERASNPGPALSTAPTCSRTRRAGTAKPTDKLVLIILQQGTGDAHPFQRYQYHRFFATLPNVTTLVAGALLELFTYALSRLPKQGTSTLRLVRPSGFPNSPALVRAWRRTTILRPRLHYAVPPDAVRALEAAYQACLRRLK